MMSTLIRITLKTRERLQGHMKYGDTFNSVINRLLDIADMEAALQLPPEEEKPP